MEITFPGNAQKNRHVGVAFLDHAAQHRHVKITRLIAPALTTDAADPVIRALAAAHIAAMGKINGVGLRFGGEVRVAEDLPAVVVVQPQAIRVAAPLRTAVEQTVGQAVPGFLLDRRDKRLRRFFQTKTPSDFVAMTKNVRTAAGKGEEILHQPRRRECVTSHVKNSLDIGPRQQSVGDANAGTGTDKGRIEPVILAAPSRPIPNNDGNAKVLELTMLRGDAVHRLFNQKNTHLAYSRRRCVMKIRALPSS